MPIHRESTVTPVPIDPTPLWAAAIPFLFPPSAQLYLHLCSVEYKDTGQSCGPCTPCRGPTLSVYCPPPQPHSV